MFSSTVSVLLDRGMFFFISNMQGSCRILLSPGYAEAMLFGVLVITEKQRSCTLKLCLKF